MPELPEVETMRRGILGVVGATLVGAERLPCALKPILVQPALARFRRRAVGRRVTVVDRIGKRVVLRLDSGDAIILEPRMTGLVLVAESPDTAHLRFRLRFLGGQIQQILYWDRRGLGSVRLLSRRQIEQQLGPGKLGPDALTVTVDELWDGLHHSQRAIKVALLDQQTLAGVGNLYASEILHVAGIHPQQRCCRLSRDTWRRLQAAMLHVLEEAIRYEGSTLADSTYRNVLSAPGSYQNQHRVYDLAGQRCPKCAEGVIRRIVQAQRSTFFCPRCQQRN